MATTPSWWEQQSPLQQQQRCLRINGNNTITTRATTQAWWQAMRATMLAWQQWRCLCINEGNDTIMTMAKTPAHWQWQQFNYYKGNNASLTNDEWLVCIFFLDQIGFLSKTTSLWPSQHRKEGLDKGDCIDSSMTLNNCVHHWTGWVEVASPPEGKRASWQF